MQSYAIKSREAITKIMNNLPDAVLLLSDHTQQQDKIDEFLNIVEVKDNPTIRAGYIGAVEFGLNFCNKMADKFFDVNLSSLNDSKDLSLGEYLLLQSKCLF